MSFVRGLLDRPAKVRDASAMPPLPLTDLPEDQPDEAKAEADAGAPPVSAVSAAKPPAEPVSPAKEWGAAVVLMIVLGLISAAFVSVLRG